MTPLTFTITGQMPSGKNRVRITRTGHHYPEPRFIKWRAETVPQLLRQTVKQVPPIATPVNLVVSYWPGDARTRDLSGMLDALFYLLVFVGVLKDDGLVYDCHWVQHTMDRADPRVIVTVEERAARLYVTETLAQQKQVKQKPVSLPYRDD